LLSSTISSITSSGLGLGELEHLVRGIGQRCGGRDRAMLLIGRQMWTGFVEKVVLHHRPCVLEGCADLQFEELRRHYVGPAVRHETDQMPGFVPEGRRIKSRRSRSRLDRVVVALHVGDHAGNEAWGAYDEPTADLILYVDHRIRVLRYAITAHGFRFLEKTRRLLGSSLEKYNALVTTKQPCELFAQQIRTSLQTWILALIASGKRVIGHPARRAFTRVETIVPVVLNCTRLRVAGC
jgi:hypothetical protein